MRSLISLFVHSLPKDILHVVFLLFVCVLGFIGLFSIFFPKTWMGEGKTGIWGFFGAITGIFPESIRPWVARVLGVLLVGLCVVLIKNVAVEEQESSTVVEGMLVEYRQKVVDK